MLKLSREVQQLLTASRHYRNKQEGGEEDVSDTVPFRFLVAGRGGVRYNLSCPNNGPSVEPISMVSIALLKVNTMKASTAVT